MNDDTLDCLVIGSGPAGLVAALYLGRLCRQVAVVDDGASRVAMIPRSRNVPGFPAGIAGPPLLERMRIHAQSFGARLEIGLNQINVAAGQAAIAATAIHNRL